MNRVRLLVILISLVMVFVLSACSSSKLVGWWSRADYDGSMPYDIVLEKGGTARVEGFPGDWKEENGKLYLADPQWDSEVYNYELSGDQLTLRNARYPETYGVYERK